MNTILNWLCGETAAEYGIPMQHDGIYALMSWRDLMLARQAPAATGEGWLLLLILALWLPVLLLV